MIYLQTEKIVELAAKALDSKKAIDMTCLKVSDLTVVTEYFIMASATSSTHVHALADEVEDLLSKSSVEPLHIEGRATDWVLLDYGSVIVHVFTAGAREFYNLDKIWNDGERIELEKIISKKA